MGKLAAQNAASTAGDVITGLWGQIVKYICGSRYLIHADNRSLHRRDSGVEKTRWNVRLGRRAGSHEGNSQPGSYQFSCLNPECCILMGTRTLP